jgi:serine protease Do
MTRTLRLIASAAVLAAAPAAPLWAQEADRSFQFAAPADAPQTFADLIATVSPAVVSIEASGTVEPGDAPDLSQVPPQFREFFERFGGGPAAAARTPLARLGLLHFRGRLPGHQQPCDR